MPRHLSRAGYARRRREIVLRRQSLARDHSFLLASISRSNLNPAVRKVLKELITGKLRRPKHRPRRDPSETHMIGLRRALCVLDLEAKGWDKREAAIEEAKKYLDLKYSTIEKAVFTNTRR